MMPAAEAFGPWHDQRKAGGLPSVSRRSAGALRSIGGFTLMPGVPSAGGAGSRGGVTGTRGGGDGRDAAGGSGSAVTGGGGAGRAGGPPG